MVSYEAIAALPEHLVGEIVGGDLIISGRLGAREAFATTSLIGELPIKQSNWLILLEPELHLGDDVLVPNIAGWLWSEAPPLTERFTVAPRWVCETLSLTTAATDRTRKLDAYRGHGVMWVWFLEPHLRTLEVLRRDERGWVLAANHGGSEVSQVLPFGDMQVNLGDLWLTDV